MCGIAGVMIAGDKPVDQAVLRQMTDQIAHRGPDDDGFFIGAGVGLGHRRLSIIDAAGGHQPMFSPDERVVITYNGEIYNFQQLRRELEALGHSFRTNCDTEVLLTSYLEWGQDCVTRLRGMFAFAIWDTRREELFLARDRLGIKPLYFANLGDGSFIFGSELKALMVYPGVGRKMRIDALEDYLALGYVPDPKSILDDVEQLSPGYTLTVNKRTGQQRQQPFWRLDVVTPAVGEEHPEELLERLEEAVKLRMIADVPLGAFLSGGLDSSTVVGLMSRNNPEPIETCSIGSDDPLFDESGHAELVSDHFGTHHRMRLVSARDGGLIDLMASVYDEPFADVSALPTYRVCALAREKVKVALSGDGGDELFAGYRRHRFHMIEEELRSRIPLGIRKPVFAALAAVYPKLDRAPRFLRAKSTFEALARTSAEAYFQTVSRTPDSVRLKLHTSKMQSRLFGYHPQERFRKLTAEVSGAHPLSIIQYLDFKTYLPGDILTKVDRASMAHGLEVRVPILDHKFVEWGFRLDPETRIRDGVGKSVFKDAVRGFVPDSIIDRPKKGFDIPVADWLRNELADDVRKLTKSERLLDTGLFSRKAIERMIDDHMHEKRDHQSTLWSLMMLERSMEQLDLFYS